MEALHDTAGYTCASLFVSPMFRSLHGKSVRMSATSSQKVVLKSTTKVSLNER